MRAARTALIACACAILPVAAHGADDEAAHAASRRSVVRPADVKAVPAPAAHFTGRAEVRALTKPVAPGQAGTSLVTFAPGARTDWHSHPAGQALVVTDGCGWTQVMGGPVERVCRGDVVYVPPGVTHWHGGTAASRMSHVAVSETLRGSNVTWGRPVTDAMYRGPSR